MKTDVFLYCGGMYVVKPTPHSYSDRILGRGFTKAEAKQDYKRHKQRNEICQCELPDKSEASRYALYIVKDVINTLKTLSCSSVFRDIGDKATEDIGGETANVWKALCEMSADFRHKKIGE